MGDERKPDAKQRGERETLSPIRSRGVAEPMEQLAPVVEEPLLLGAPPRAHEPQRPAIGESSSQPPPGAMGNHANPVGPGDKVGQAPVVPPGHVIPPQPAPDMTATGAADGPHPPAPGSGERRVAQQDWERWRAEDRRKVPFEYPYWRT